MIIDLDNMPAGLVKKLFYKKPEQEIIPFLGAGVPISDRIPEASDENLSSSEIDELKNWIANLESLELEPKAREFLELSFHIGSKINRMEKQRISLVKTKNEQLKQSNFPPSTSELSHILTGCAGLRPFYSSFEQILNILSLDKKAKIEYDDFLEWMMVASKICNLGNINEPLTLVAEYCQNVNGRKQMLDDLEENIGFKNTPTATHELIASAAKYYLNNKNVSCDYLIITTNYDCLMEHELDRRKIPWAVLFERSEKEQTKISLKTHVRFSKNLRNNNSLIKNNPPIHPDSFYLKGTPRLVVIYKIHGCLNPDEPKFDSVVISEKDYINFISRRTNGNSIIVPAHIRPLISDKSFLFLGYSLRDWNIRILYEQISANEGRISTEPDYLVTNHIDQFEEGYYQKDKKIIVIRAGLKDFAEKIQQAHQLEAISI